MKRAGNIISTVLIVILIVLLCAVLIPKFFFGVEMKAVQTASMEPDLPVGSLLIIVPAAYEDINVGDDITYVRDEQLTLVTHRVISKDDENQKLTTQGTANNTPDNPVSYQNIVGKVMFSIPLLGYILIWTSTLAGKIILGIIIVSLVALSIILGKDEPKKKNRQKAKTSEGNSQENPQSFTAK